jgi:beta-phosphoglucomutase-like phosphatase (HAD superfamily)
MPTRTRFKAVIFDCDGLLLDTEHAYTIAEAELCARYGYDYRDEDKRLLLGSSFEAAGRIFERLLKQPGRAVELSEEFLALLKARGPHVPPARPGARDLVSPSPADCLSRSSRTRLANAGPSPRVSP